jgi:hypothetical protein
MGGEQDTPRTAGIREEISVSVRLTAIEQVQVQTVSQLSQQTGQLGQQTALLQQLVGFASAKDEREREALQIEKDRREASAEGARARIEAETAERRTNAAWLRAQAERLITPFSAFVGVVLTGIGALLLGYLSGRFGLPVTP